MTKLVTLATMALLVTAGAHAADDGDMSRWQSRPLTEGIGDLCSNLLHRYPTDAPMVLALRDGAQSVMVCQGWSSLAPTWLTFANAGDLAWWRDHTEDRPIVDGEGDDD